MIALIGLYFTRYRHQSADVFVPRAAWLRACIYFCACYLIGIATGVFDDLFTAPIATTNQLENTVWWIWIGGLFLLVTAAYWGIWARYTLRFDRRRDVIPQTVFGLLWGVTSGLLFLSFYQIAQTVGSRWPAWLVWLLAYGMISVWQGLWHDYYWDLYVSPEHDTPFSIKLKVMATHIPNITACLIFFAIYENVFVFVALQTWALVGASLAMRMPAPWSQDIVRPATRTSGLFGLPRASGYVSPNPKTDAYLEAAHLPR